MKNKQLNIITIKELMKKGCPIQEVLAICEKIYNMLGFLSKDYPKQKSWFYKKHLPETLDLDSGRDIIFVYDKDKKIYGTAFVKKDNIEKKICTLYVAPDARGIGIGTQLVEKSIEILGTTKPLITFADYKLSMFEGLIKKYQWEKTEEIPGLYNDINKELVYNGYLTK